MRLIGSTHWGLTSKIVTAILAVSVLMWWILDNVQSQQLREHFLEKEYQRLERGSMDDRHLFDQYAQAVFRSVKLIVGQKRFVDFVSAMPELDTAPEVEIAHQSTLPAWMPRSSLMRTFYRARYALLYDQNNFLRAIYHHGQEYDGAESMPDELITSSNILRKLSHNQAYMTTVGDAPYLIASERVRMGRGTITLLLVMPIDSQFLKEVASEQNHQTMIALLDRDSHMVVSSSNVERIPEGSLLGDLEEEFLIAGKSFFDYGSSDLKLQLTSFAPKAEVFETVDALMAESNFHRAVLVVVMMATVMVIMLLFVRRVLKVGRTVNYYSKHLLGRDITEHTEGDELHILGRQVDTLGREVVSLRNELNMEVDNATRIAADLEARTDSLSLANEQLASEVEERKRSEAERDLLHKQLQKAQRMDAIGQTTGGVAHDFNNILAAILGFTALAEAKFAGTDESGDLRLYLTKITEAGERGRDLVTSMLAFSRGEAGEQRALALEQEIHGVIGMLRPTISSSIEIRTFVRDKDLIVDFDPIKLQQVVMNMVVNARDSFERGKGAIEISLGRTFLDPCECSSCHEEVEGEFIELSIRDTGRGIAAESLANIFEPFFSTKGVGEGSGMGLSVIHGIMHASHGHILVESEPGKGTWFRLLFKPSAVGSEALNNASGDAEYSFADGGEGRRRILVVDDEIALTYYLRELLEMNGYKVETTNNPLEAFDMLNSAPEAFDLVITDQTMPQLSGVELTAKIRQVNASLPVIMCTGYSATTNEAMAREAGVDEFLTKPINGQQLLNAITGQLRKRTVAS